ncbi:MAG TPA: DNA-binding domain-containing protein, partial [Coxiellaceae bacterium]|nr:DNA-binding domain-containing protein [Coxiellaceae bacterium]
MKLVELQKCFQESVLQQKTLPRACLHEPPSGSSEERLQIYQDAYYLRLIGHLKSKYSALQKALGVEDFNKLVVNYLKKYPSHG